MAAADVGRGCGLVARATAEHRQAGDVRPPVVVVVVDVQFRRRRRCLE